MLRLCWLPLRISATHMQISGERRSSSARPPPPALRSPPLFCPARRSPPPTRVGRRVAKATERALHQRGQQAAVEARDAALLVQRAQRLGGGGAVAVLQRSGQEQRFFLGNLARKECTKVG